jgi:hypothetical protein
VGGEMFGLVWGFWAAGGEAALGREELFLLFFGFWTARGAALGRGKAARGAALGRGTMGCAAGGPTGVCGTVGAICSVEAGGAWSCHALMAVRKASSVGWLGTVWPGGRKSASTGNGR